MRADPACRNPEHRDSDWTLEQHPPSRGLVLTGTVQYRNSDNAPASQGEGLSPTEAGRLTELEQVVARGLQTFVEVGTALAEIRDRRLYRQSHRTFEEYCRERWGMRRSHADRMIDAADVVQAVSPIGDIDSPSSESVARELAPLKDDPEELRETWTETVAEHGPKPTVRQVREVRQRAPEPVESYSTRISKVDPDLAKRVRDGNASLEYAESVTAERQVRLNVWAEKLRDALGVLRLMAGNPVPPGVSERLTVDEREQLHIVLEVLAEALGYGSGTRTVEANAEERP